MKNSQKIILGATLLSMLFSLTFLSNTYAADPVALNTSQEVQYITRIQANYRTTFQYQAQTRLTINSTVNVDLILSCEASKIGAKTFEIEIEGDGDLEMNMTCTEEQADLGLLLGNRYTARNRNRFLYQEAFCISLECNGTFKQAKLMIQATSHNGGGSWAYYDDAKEEWVTVPTIIEDGYLVATIDHFSTWTILIPETDILPYIIAGVALFIGIIAAFSIVGIVIYMKKR